MLPLGLLLIAQDGPLLQKPLVASFARGERKCDWLRSEMEKQVGLERGSNILITPRS